MIYEKNGVFHLEGNSISYIFMIDDAGHLEHLYFGPKLGETAGDSFRLKPGFGFGTSVEYLEGDPSSCLNDLPYEWSGFGYGDYRESPLEIEDSEGLVFTDLTYCSYKILLSKDAPNFELPHHDGSDEILQLKLADENAGIIMFLYYSVCGDVICRSSLLKNTGNRILYTRKMMSFCMDMLGDLEILTLNGGWIREAHIQKSEIGPTKQVIESLTGFSSNIHNPAFSIYERKATEDCGLVYGFNLIYSGNHYASVQKNASGINRIMQGISPHGLRWELKPGEYFESPECVLTVSNQGFNGMSGNMHRFINEHIVPKYWRKRPRPILFNSWEACMFDFNERKLIDLADRASKLGCELFVMDDGWFGERNDDTKGLGDYTVNLKKLPGGLRGLSGKVRNRNMKFGIWVEPEGVNPNSEIYREHPDWILSDGRNLPRLGRHEHLLDLTRSEVQDYIVEQVRSVIEESGAEYLKWDVNRNSPVTGNKAHQYILSLYSILKRIFADKPEVLLESCASGGNRFDLGMLCFSPQIWASDDTDPIERLDIQKGLSYFYPPSVMGCHVSASPHAQTLRSTPLETRANAAFFGCLGYELDLNHLSTIEIKQIREQIKFYKNYRLIFQYGIFTRTDIGTEGEQWQVSDDSDVILGRFRRISHAAPPYENIVIKHLDPEASYKVTSRINKIGVQKFGGMINYVSPVKLNPGGIVLHEAGKFLTVKDAAEEFTEKGAVLMQGFVPQNLFAGTGYDGRQRLVGDFGSELYLISKKA